MSQFLVSVVIPVYNIENYIKEALDSVISQTIGFNSNIEIILVDDGSSDSSGDICKEYLSRYPDNIKYFRQKNSGVSRARNEGMSFASGEYIHFLDGDDSLPADYYEKMIRFLGSNQEVDFVASKLMFYDLIIDSHPLNFKFDKTHIVDVNKEPNSPIFHVISCVFRRDAINNLKFDENLSIAEDVKFISDALVKSGRYGVVSDTVYYYRKRAGSISAIGGKENNKDYYLSVPERCYRHILNEWSKRGDGRRWAEYVLMYDMSYRLDQKEQSILTSDEEGQYRDSILDILGSCSDEVIVVNPFLDLSQKIYILRSKYNDEFTDYLSVESSQILFRGYKLCDYSDFGVYIDFLSSDSRYVIEGYIGDIAELDDLRYRLVVNNHSQRLKFVERKQLQREFLGDVYSRGGAFQVEFDFPVESNIFFHIEDRKGEVLHRMRIRTGQFTGLGALRWSYRKDDGRLISRTNEELISTRYTKIGHLVLELRMLLQIVLNWRLRTAKDQLSKLRSRNLRQLSVRAKLFEVLKPLLIVGEAVYKIPSSIMLRMAHNLSTSRKRRPIWIISDRGMAAGDNGEAFFKYLTKRSDLPADVFFVISKKSLDYDRMKEIGPVLNHGSLRHKLKHLLADKIISSQADIETTNPFIRQVDHFIDLFKFDFIFLQHGVIRHDLSDWLNRFNKNIHRFVVTSEKEYNSLFSNPYYYPEDRVVLSGLPRYDLLESNPQKKIILSPTYRKSLARMKTDKNGSRNYDPLFKYSEYRDFYNRFINDDRLISAMKEYGVTGEFYLHPVFSSQRSDFDENDTFKLMHYPYNYKKAFEEGSLLISDHSSVVFDFAYLRKPVLYAYFDVDTFFMGHTYSKSDFFSDRLDGFGEVCDDYSSLVDETIKSIRNNFKLSDKYRNRIDKYFAFSDQGSSKRLYERIIGDHNVSRR